MINDFNQMRSELEYFVTDKIKESKILLQRKEEATNLLSDLESIINASYTELLNKQYEMLKQLSLPIDEELLFNLRINKIKLDIHKKYDTNSYKQYLKEKENGKNRYLLV